MIVRGARHLAEVEVRVLRGARCAWALAYSRRSSDGTVLPTDFTGWTARAEAGSVDGRESWAGVATEVSEADGERLLVRLSLPAAVTAGLDWADRRRGRWEVELLPPGEDPIPLAAGRLTVES